MPRASVLILAFWDYLFDLDFLIDLLLSIVLSHLVAPVSGVPEPQNSRVVVVSPICSFSTGLPWNLRLDFYPIIFDIDLILGLAHLFVYNLTIGLLWHFALGPLFLCVSRGSRAFSWEH